MPRASFSFGTSTSYTVEVNYTWWGREEYYVNGRLLERRWNASLSGKRQFHIGGHSVRIEVFIGQRQYFTRVFVDDKLHVEELFPTAKSQFGKWRQPRRQVVVVIAGVVAALGVLWLIGVSTR
jgi:hypothetical protein